jgi:hypothetical protein
LIETGSVIAGRAPSPPLPTAITGVPEPIANWIVSLALVRFAAAMASRNVQFGEALQAPSLVSAVEFTVNVDAAPAG